MLYIMTLTVEKFILSVQGLRTGMMIIPAVVYGSHRTAKRIMPEMYFIWRLQIMLKTTLYNLIMYQKKLRICLTMKLQEIFADRHII